MDGNGRWALKRGKPRSYGHVKGSENVDRITRYAFSRGIKTLSLYVFSSENWSRPQEEIDKLFSLLRSYLKKPSAVFKDNGVSLRVSGDLSALPEDLRKDLERVVEETAGGEKRLNLAINYGSRAEIMRAVKTLAESGDEITEENFKKRLYTYGLDDPELIIRTSGEKRLSNFMMYQAAYSEFYFTDVLWPDFNENEFEKALADFSHRGRRFGGINEK
ncbi:MAG: polyprenyl diphosphate synthase [Clostridia bacterium]|nr:polyprenyl diphosphate synthase [Clostridia bacterium]